MTAIKYRTADVDGSKVFYREAGPADAPKLLLLHGFPTASHMFRDLIPLLADRWHMADELGVQPSACCMIAAHVWDTIGAQSAGLAAGLILRSGNAAACARIAAAACRRAGPAGAGCRIDQALAALTARMPDDFAWPAVRGYSRPKNSSSRGRAITFHVAG